MVAAAAIQCSHTSHQRSGKIRANVCLFNFPMCKFSWHCWQLWLLLATNPAVKICMPSQVQSVLFMRVFCFPSKRMAQQREMLKIWLLLLFLLFFVCSFRIFWFAISPFNIWFCMHSLQFFFCFWFLLSVTTGMEVSNVKSEIITEFLRNKFSICRDLEET